MIIDIDGRLRATRFGTRKMPPPIMHPATIAMESVSESCRASSVRPLGALMSDEGKGLSVSRFKRNTSDRHDRPKIQLAGQVASVFHCQH
jgi:hypothetical protein